MRKLLARIFKKKSHGQVLLETAIVFISIAVLAIGAMALFSNLKSNLLARQNVYRQSQVEAVNSRMLSYTPGNALSPITYLEYSPNYSLTGTGHTPFAPVIESFGEARLETAEEYFDIAARRMETIIPLLIGQIYEKLGGDEITVAQIEYVISPVDVREAIGLTASLRTLIQDTYNYYGEDMDGIDADHDGFIGGIGLMQDVWNNPTENGPFDAHLGCAIDDKVCLAAEQEHKNNLDGLAESIRNMKEHVEPSACQFLIQSLQKIPLLGRGCDGSDKNVFTDLLHLMQRVELDLNCALRGWGACKTPSLVIMTCHGLELWQVYYIQEARMILKQLNDAGLAAVPAPLPGSLVERINTLYALLNSSPFTRDNALEARNQVQAMLDGDWITPDTRTMKSSLEKIKANLDNAISYWEDAEQRERYLRYARLEAEDLHYIVNIKIGDDDEVK